MVSVVPLMAAGPESTANVTGRPELAVADSGIGAAPYATGETSGAKVMV